MSRPASTSPLGFIQPEIPSLVPDPPSGTGWIHEIKHDGYRTLIVVDRGRIRAFTRNGYNWSKAYRRVVEAAGKIRCETAILDGEMVVQDENGVSDFHALQTAIHSEPHRILFFAFDLLNHNGDDLRGKPLLERRALLRKLIKPDLKSPIQFSDHVDGDGAEFFQAAARLGLEGIISKRAASRYRSGRSKSWVKTKNMVESEFVLLGTERDSNGLVWALLGRDDRGFIEFAGPAIFRPPQHLRATWAERMAKLAIPKSLLKGVRGDNALWFRPEVRVMVRHLKTKGTLRHARVLIPDDRFTGVVE